MNDGRSTGEHELREGHTTMDFPSEGDNGTSSAQSNQILYEHTSSFWQEPLPPLTYLEPPFYPNHYVAETERAVAQFCSYLDRTGWQEEAFNLLLQFHTLVQAPGDEFERLRQELEPERLKLEKPTEAETQVEKEIEDCRRKIEQKRNEFIQQMAKARLPLPQQEPLAISPRLVEDALNRDFATADEICGQYGVTPAGESSRWAVFHLLGQWLMELFAPLAAGLMLGVNVAVVTGFLHLADFRQGRQMWLVALAAFLGLLIEKLVGAVCYSLTSSLAQSSEDPLTIDGAQPFPRLRTTGCFTILLQVFAILLGTAVVTVDALGLRMLHEEAVQQAKLLGTATSGVLPFWVYLIAGCVLSLPYLTYKATMGWRQTELRLRDARIAYLRWRHIEERRSEPEVQEAFRLAQEVVDLRERLPLLKERLSELQKRRQERLQEIRTRLDSARTQSVGCQLVFKHHWHELSRQIAAINRRARANVGKPDTLLRRLMRAIGGDKQWAHDSSLASSD